MPNVVQERMADRADRCDEGFHLATQHPGLCVCGAGGTSEWQIFYDALRRARRDDGTIHASDVRRVLGTRIAPRKVGTLYRRARNDGLIVEAGHERSDDHKGKNAGRLEPYYEMRAA